jgi:hypothetical protein
MICGVCKYTDRLVYTSNPTQVKCAITGEFHYNDDVCDCEFSRLLYDKRSNMVDKGTEAVNSLEALREKIQHGLKTVDVEYLYNTLNEVTAEGITSEKLQEAIAYLEEFMA